MLGYLCIWGTALAIARLRWGKVCETLPRSFFTLAQSTEICQPIHLIKTNQPRPIHEPFNMPIGFRSIQTAQQVTVCSEALATGYAPHIANDSRVTFTGRAHGRDRHALRFTHHFTARFAGHFTVKW